MSINLIPVLELEPGDYKNPEREYIFSDFYPVQERFWKDCLKDSGILVCQVKRYRFKVYSDNYQQTFRRSRKRIT